MKRFRITIELEAFEVVLDAKNKADARKKALARLNRRKPSTMIAKEWGSGRKQIDIED